MIVKSPYVLLDTVTGRPCNESQLTVLLVSVNTTSELCKLIYWQSYWATELGNSIIRIIPQNHFNYSSSQNLFWGVISQVCVKHKLTLGKNLLELYTLYMWNIYSHYYQHRMTQQWQNKMRANTYNTGRYSELLNKVKQGRFAADKWTKSNMVAITGSSC